LHEEGEVGEGNAGRWTHISVYWLKVLIRWYISEEKEKEKKKEMKKEK
jgi:hypothetical protein